MFRLWGKIFSENRLVKDIVIEDTGSDTRTHKIFHAIDEICLKFDISPRTHTSERNISESILFFI